MPWAACLTLTLTRLPQTHRGAWGQQQPMEMPQMGCPIAWQERTGPRVSRKPEDVIEFPIITALRAATLNIAGAFLGDLLLHEGLFLVLCSPLHLIEDPDRSLG